MKEQVVTRWALSIAKTEDWIQSLAIERRKKCTWIQKNYETIIVFADEESAKKFMPKRVEPNFK